MNKKHKSKIILFKLMVTNYRTQLMAWVVKEVQWIWIAYCLKSLIFLNLDHLMYPILLEIICQTKIFIAVSVEKGSYDV